MELLNLVRSAHFGQTRLGPTWSSCGNRFPGPVVADMFCLLQVELELAIRAKGMLMARQAGLDTPAGSGLEGPAAGAALPPAIHRPDRVCWR